MKILKNNTWLVILMVISQIMLTGLLIAWLRSQWQNERELFQKDLNTKFTECVNQVMDSMLVKHLITPVLNDTSIFEDHLEKIDRKTTVDTNYSDKHVTAFLNSSGDDRRTMITITLPDSGRRIKKEDASFASYDSNEKKMLLRSVKLIIKETGDSEHNGTIPGHIISFVPDTILLKKLLADKFVKPAERFNIIWKSDTIRNNSDANRPVLYFKTSLFEKPLHMEVTNYQGVILKNISLQILFALVLLFITSAAFIFTHKSMKKQESLNTLRNDFINNISHELKTPISTVSIALEALKNFDMIYDPSKANEYLDIAFSEMKRLDLLVSNVLNTSILEDQSEFLVLEEQNIVKLTKEVLNSMALRFRERNAKVEFTSIADIISLKIDKLHIQGVLVNLLDNSLKYGSENPEIKICIEQKSSSVVLSLGDNGPGIPKEYLSKVFDKFFRVPKGDVHDIKGYGLGLSFAKLVMILHSGSINVSNKAEGGCEFILTFRRKEK